MIQRLNRLGIFFGPIWLQLLVGFIVAVVVPSIMLLVLILGGVQEASRQNVLRYVTENGSRQVESIEGELRQSRLTIDNFITDPDIQLLMLELLPESSATSTVPDPLRRADPFKRVEFTTRMQATLLSSTRGPLQQVDLIDVGGRLVARALPNQTPGLVVAEDLSTTNAFQVARNADLVGRSEQIAFSISDGQTVIEIIDIIKRPNLTTSELTTAGYLITRLDADLLVENTLRFGTEFFDASSYMVSPAGILITGQGAETIAPAYARQLIDGEASILGDMTSVIRYQNPLSSTDFEIISEGSAQSILGLITTYIVTRSFVLVVGLVGLVTLLVIGANASITPPLGRIRSAISAMAAGNFNTPVPDLNRRDEIGALAGSFADMREQVQLLISELEHRIEARTRDITATQDISNFAATQRDVQSLMNQVVNLIVERFDNIYHAQIFLVDQDRQYAVLRASTGEPGKKLLQAGHRLAVGSVSVIGQVTELGQHVVARDTAESQVHRRNEYLPDTLAELAIALRNANGEIIGALDVQSKQSDTFTEDQVKVLQTMADQISVAIENARLYAESLRRLQEIERSRQAATLGAWREFMRQEHNSTKHSAAGLPPQTEMSGELRQMAMDTGETQVGTLTIRRTIPVAVPIRLRGQVLGAVEWEIAQENFDQNRLQLAEDLVNRLAIGLENARLFQESQRTADRERLVNEIAARLTAQTDVDQILQMAVREVGQALRAPQVSIRLTPSAKASMNGHESTSNGHSKTSRLSYYEPE